MAQVIVYTALILLSICILSHCRTLETSNYRQYRKFFAPKQIEKDVEKRSLQQNPSIRVKRHVNPPPPASTPYPPSDEYNSYEVIPYANVGSSYFNADGTRVKAPVYNYGFFNYPYFLASQYKHPDYQNYDNDDYADEETQTAYYDDYDER